MRASSNSHCGITGVTTQKYLAHCEELLKWKRCSFIIVEKLLKFMLRYWNNRRLVVRIVELLRTPCQSSIRRGECWNKIALRVRTQIKSEINRLTSVSSEANGEHMYSNCKLLISNTSYSIEWGVKWNLHRWPAVTAYTELTLCRALINLTCITTKN